MSVIYLSEKNFKEEIKQSALPILVDFYTNWCGPCKRMEPIIEEIAKEYTGKLKVAKINVEEATNIANQYAIMSVPTILIFKNNKVVTQIQGAVPKTELKKKIDVILS